MSILSRITSLGCACFIIGWGLLTGVQAATPQQSWACLTTAEPTPLFIGYCQQMISSYEKFVQESNRLDQATTAQVHTENIFQKIRNYDNLKTELMSIQQNFLANQYQVATTIINLSGLAAGLSDTANQMLEQGMNYLSSTSRLSAWRKKNNFYADKYIDINNRLVPILEQWHEIQNKLENLIHNVPLINKCD